MHVAEGPLNGSARGGDEVYRFFRACADWPSMVGRDQAISVQVRVELLAVRNLPPLGNGRRLLRTSVDWLA